ncbi:MAG: type VI secretion system baseplate subunit TssK [Planctomycetales bacterium]|nr:type VI secretion system baseplate subunit TssK [Planctomycetales bacterium]
MRNPAVNWSEGMFLRPQHFQAAERYWAERLSHNIDFCTPFSYGLQRVVISSEALANGCLELSGLRARWQDGTILCQEENHVERVDLKKRLDPKLGKQPVTAYLALPILQDGQPNVTQDTGGLFRYREFSRSIDDETLGGNRQEIFVRLPNYRILFSHEEMAGYDILPIARLVPSQTMDGQYLIDSDYFPPSLTIQAWPDLAGVVRAIYDVIGSRIQSLCDIIQTKNITLSSQSQGDLEKILLLHALNEASGELSCLAFAPGVHPLVAYTSLCRIVGKVAIFGRDLVVNDVPPYDHEDLARIFKWTLDKIRKLIFSVKEDEYEQRYFVGSGRGMVVQLEPEWFGLEWDWYFGVDPVNISRDALLYLLKNTIDWKLGSSDKVEHYMTVQQPGVKLRPVAQIPRALPSRGNWVFLEIKREGDAWQHVQATQSLAMRVRSEQIANLDSLEGTRRLRLAIDGQTYGLEFAVFAVRKRV